MNGGVQHRRMAAWLDGYEEGRRSMRPLAIMGLVVGILIGAPITLALVEIARVWFS